MILKTMFRSTVILIFILGISPLCYAESSSDKTSVEVVKKEMEDLLKALKGYTSDQRDEASQKAKEALDILDMRIEGLETRIDNNWDKMDKQARKKARETLKILRKQRTQVAEWYGSLKSSSANAWSHMKKGFSDAFESLHDSWKKSEKEFGSDQ